MQWIWMYWIKMLSYWFWLTQRGRALWRKSGKCRRPARISSEWDIKSADCIPLLELVRWKWFTATSTRMAKVKNNQLESPSFYPTIFFKM
jgi:hypothetical protein